MVRVLVATTVIFAYSGYLAFGFYFYREYKPGISAAKVPVVVTSALKKSSKDCMVEECEWNIYTENQDFNKDYSFDLIESITDSIFNSSDTSISLPVCMPLSFGYSPQEAEIVFPAKDFERCEELQKENSDIISINMNRSELVMNCESNGIYYLGNSAYNELLGFDTYETAARPYIRPVKLKKPIEWAYGTCKNRLLNPEGATYTNFFNKAAYSRALESMKSIQSEFNSSKTTPLTVLMITIDSISRKHFYRKLPKTLKFLRSLKHYNSTVVDFKLHNIIGDNSIPNIYATLTGIPHVHSSKSPHKENIQKKSDLIEKDAIWTYLKARGWVTLFGTEFCEDYFSYELGRKPNVDHLLARFWCAGEKLSGFSATSTEPRCIGNKFSHYYMLNYTYQFTRNYQGVNKWAHVMLVPGHEDSGSVISTLDLDLSRFLEEVMRFKDMLMVFLVADHGPRFGNWKKTLEGAQEHKLPMLFFIAPDELLKEIPSVYDILDHNSKRLVAKIDLHMTLKHISYLPYNKSFQIGSFYHNSWQAGKPKAYSLLLEKISTERTCEDASIYSIYCSCNEYKLIDQAKQPANMISFLRYIAEEIVDQINEESLTNFASPSWQICSNIRLSRILSVKTFKYNSQKQAYRFVFSVNDDEDLQFEAEVDVFTSQVTRRPAKLIYRARNLLFAGKLQMKVSYIRRLSELDPLCTEIALLHKILPSICICRPISQQPEVSLMDYQITFSAPGESCKSHCSNLQQSCSSLATTEITCTNLSKFTTCLTCSTSTLPYAPLLSSHHCLTSSSPSICSQSHPHVIRACICIP